MANKKVDVTLNLVGNFESTIQRLEKRLDEIDNKHINPTLNIDDDGSIEKVKSELKSLEKNLTTKVDVRGASEIARVKTMKESLSGTETITVKTKRLNSDVAKKGRETMNRVASKRADSDIPASKKVSQVKSREARRQTRRAMNLKESFPGPRPFAGQDGMDFKQAHRRLKDRGFGDGDINIRDVIGGLSRMANRARARALSNNAAVSSHLGTVDTGDYYSRARNKVLGGTAGPLRESKFRLQRSKMGLGGKFLNQWTGDRNRRRSMSNVKRVGSKVGGGLGKAFTSLIPSGKFARQISSILMVSIMSMIENVAGIIAAMGSTAIAAGSILALGLGGMGNTPGQAKQNAGRRIKQTGRETFQALQPAMETFTPITNKVLSGLPDQLSRLNDDLIGLEVFEGAIQPAIGGIIGFVEDLLTAMADLNTEITQLSFRFGRLAGNGLITIFRRLIKATHRSQGEFISLVKTFGYVLRAGLALARLWGKTMTVLRPLFKIIAALAKFMNNKWGVALLKTIVLFGLLAKTIGKVVAAMKAYSAMMKMVAALTGIQSMLGLLSAAWNFMTASIWRAVAALTAFIGVATLGVGLVSAIGSIGAAKGAVPSGNGYNGSAGIGSGAGAGGGLATGQGGGNVVYQMNVDGNTDKDTMNKFEDMAADESRNQDNLRERERRGR